MSQAGWQSAAQAGPQELAAATSRRVFPAVSGALTRGQWCTHPRAVGRSFEGSGALSLGQWGAHQRAVGHSPDGSGTLTRGRRERPTDWEHLMHLPATAHPALDSQWSGPQTCPGTQCQGVPVAAGFSTGTCCRQRLAALLQGTPVSLQQSSCCSLITASLLYTSRAL